MFGKHISDTELVSRIYKEHSKLIKEKANNSIQKMGKRPEETFH